MPLQMYPTKSKEKPISRIRHVIAVAAGKGGVGKSTVTVNLAFALKHMGYRVGIMDTDIYGPSIRKMLPEDRMPNQKGEIIIPALCQGINMISMAYFRKENEASIVRAPIANGVVGQFIKNVAWGELDYLLIDFPPGTGDIQLTLSQQAGLTGAIMVTTPQEVAVMDVRKAMHMFDQVKVPIVGIIENMSYYFNPVTQEKIYIFGCDGGKRLAIDSGVSFLGNIPLDVELCQSGDAGRALLMQNKEDHQIVRAFSEIAKQLVAKIDVESSQSKDYLQNFDLVWKEMT